MIKLKKENGFSLLIFIVVFIILGFTFIYRYQIVTGYMDKYILEESIEKIFVKEKNNYFIDREEIRSDILKSARLNNISIKAEDIKVQSFRNNIIVEIDFLKSIKLTERIYLMVDLYIMREMSEPIEKEEIKTNN